MAYKMNRLNPENYSEDILRVVQALKLPSGEEPIFQGSSSLKVLYPSDYDLAQYVSVETNLKREFQEVIHKLMKLKDAYIGDIKSGEIPELKVVPDNTNSNNYNARRQGFLDKLKSLYTRKYITKEEYNNSVKILKPDLTDIDISIIKHDIRFEIVRWTPNDILKGFIVYRKHKVDFNLYLFGNNITKIDVIAWVNGVRYSEITMNYKFTGNGVTLNTKGNVLNEILSEVPYLYYTGKFLKICKRMFSIETLLSNTPHQVRYTHKLTQRRLYRLFNGDLNLLNQIKGDIGNIIFLVENIKHVPKDKFEYEINQIKYRLGSITNLKYLKIQPVVVKMLNILQKDAINIRELEKLETFLSNFIEKEVKTQMKKWKLLPIPWVYLPNDRVDDVLGGGEEMVGEGLYPYVEYHELGRAINRFGLNIDGLQLTPPDMSLAEMHASPDYYIKNEKGTGSLYRFEVQGENDHDLERLRKYLLTTGGKIGKGKKMVGEGGKAQTSLVIKKKLEKIYATMTDMSANDAILRTMLTHMRTIPENHWNNAELGEIGLGWMSKKAIENDFTQGEWNELLERLNDGMDEIEHERMMGQGQKGGALKKKKKVLGGALFPNMVIEDTELPTRLNGKTMGGLGDDEVVVLKKLPRRYPNETVITRYINIYPLGKSHDKLHLEVSYKKNILHITSIDTEYMKSKGIGTYIFSILFRYLQFQHLGFDSITLTFYPTEQDPDAPIDPETGKQKDVRRQTPEVKMRAMEFYFRIFSQMANHYPMIIEQIRRPTKEDLQRIIDDYEDNDRLEMIFRKSNVF